MNFIVGLPRTQSDYDSIWVIVDRLTKVAHFIPVKTTYFGLQLAELYMSRIVCLHGVPKKIVSDRGIGVRGRSGLRIGARRSEGEAVRGGDAWVPFYRVGGGGAL
jgi:hypothetical protein